MSRPAAPPLASPTADRTPAAEAESHWGLATWRGVVNHERLPLGVGRR